MTHQPTHPSPSTRTTHPQWCHPLHCETTSTDVLHSSEPVVLEFLDARAALCVTAISNVAFPAEGFGPEVNLALTCTPIVQTGSTARVYLTLDEVAILADHLITERDRAHGGPGPDYHPKHLRT